MGDMKIGRKLKQLRLARKLTQVDLAKRAKVTQGFITHMENEYDYAPRLSTLRRLAKVLRCSISELVE